MATIVERTYLQMLAPGELKGSEPIDGVTIERASACTASFYRYLYTEVGRDYRWTDRLPWTDDQIRRHLATPGISVHVAYAGGTPAGYFELTPHADGSCEISYFGLLPDFHGRGLGRWLLTRATEEAWLTKPTRVWLHTCTLDGPAALPNYLARGFVPFKKETYQG
ncbi:MAG TPA: GNAT family N-acetyltransferase [Vicinamibacteria bacterium]|nr:GNAT family N-acetyltransferase [Vicinamibacteria bacterium]